MLGERSTAEWHDQTELSYTTLIDETHRVSSLYNLVNVPSAVWIDEDGRIVRIDEGAYSRVHDLGGFKFGTDDYSPAVRDWVEKGAESPFVLSADAVVSRIRPRSDDEALADATFKLGVYFYQQGDEERARVYWQQAQALFPDSWNMHRQDWNLTEGLGGPKFQEKRQGLGDEPYYAPFDFPSSQ